MKSVILVLLVIVSFFASKSYAIDPYFCVPNQEMPAKSKNRQHKLYKIPTPFPVSYGGYIPKFPECSLEGVVEAVDIGYKGIQVTAAYLRSQEIAMIGYETLYDFVGGDEYVYTYQITGDQFAKKVYKKVISYGNFEYEYLGVYRASFLYEIFDAIPNFRDGVFFISVLPEIPASILPEGKILGRLTMKWIKYVIDTFQAWDRVILYDSDVVKSLDIVSMSGCNHLFGYEAYSLIYESSYYASDVHFCHKAIHPLRPCANNITSFTVYTDFLLDSGSVERSSCISMTIAEMDTFDYKQNKSTNPGSLSSIIHENYYTDTSNYYVGLFANPYFVAVYEGDTAKLNTDMQDYVTRYNLDFYITPVEYSLIL